MLWLKLRVGVLTMIGLSLAGGAAVFSQQLRSPARSGSMTFRIAPTTNAVPTAALGPAAIKIKLEGTPGLAYEVSYLADGPSQTAKGVLPGEVSFPADGFQATITVPGPGEFGFEVYRGESFLATSRVARIGGTRRYVIEAKKGGRGVSLRVLPYK